MPDTSGRKLIQFITAARGNLALAAERAGMSQQDLVSAIVGDGEGSSLTEQLRAMLIVSAFDLLMQTQMQVLASLDEMKPEEVSRSYSSQLSTMQAMLKTPTPELSDEAPYDSTMAKQRIITKLENYRKREKAEAEAESSEAV